jgi:hypothetical protein
MFDYLGHIIAIVVSFVFVTFTVPVVRIDIRLTVPLVGFASLPRVDYFF